MKKDDLTQVKHVGAARMKLLNDSGIITIKQLHDTPLEKLSQIKSISEHHAKLIKESVSAFYEKTPAKPAPKAKTGRQKKVVRINQDLQKQIKLLKKRLRQANENLKPLGKKKYLESYIDLKKSFKTLRTRLKALDQKQANLSNKDKKGIVKNAAALNSTLKISGKELKKKNFTKVVKEIRSFSKMLK